LNAGVTYFLHSHHHQHPVVQQNVHQTHAATRRRNQNNNYNNHNQNTDGNPTGSNHHTPRTTTNTTSLHDSMIDTQVSSNNDHDHRDHHSPTDRTNNHNVVDAPHICCSSDDPVRDLEILHQMAEILMIEEEQMQHKQQQQQKQQQANNHNQNRIMMDTTNDTTVTKDIENNITKKEKDNNTDNEVRDVDGTIDNTRLNTENVVMNSNNSNSNSSNSSSNGDEVQHDDAEQRERKLLMRMSVNTAIAIGLHNFPEGLATFVATLHDPSVGAVLAIAIAIHNIPEGLCVALPIYYATGNRRTAFLWAILSGLSEPIAAVVGYIILANHFTSITYGILFGIVAGMMVMISTRELLPTAHRYDPNDHYVTYSFIFGMSILALSLVLFVLK
jgi:zinc transporter ZupT